MTEAAALLRRMFDAAVAAAQPEICLPGALPAPPGGRTVVLAAGKAAAAMARAVERVWDGPLSGLAITRHGHAVPCDRIEVVEAAHPVPDAAGAAATARMLDLARGLGPDDLALCLISGGGSALLVQGLPGVTLADKQAVNRALLASGATIAEMNTVRRHLSAVKGGRLAAACHPARVVTLMISDVPGDDPGTIASGPTVADPTTVAEARAVLARYGIAPPPAVAAALDRPEAETVKPGDPRLAGAEARIVASPQMALEAAAALGWAAGIPVHILGDALEGEAREMGRVMAGIARQVATRGQPFARPCILLSGGETTVTLRNPGGRGGRNVEFLLALAVELAGHPGIHALAADTDGVDGAEEVAGALIGPDTLDRMRKAGIDPRAALAANDAHTAFAAAGAQVVTGPTLTNVNDFRAILIG
ncbi:glycerate kinase type-2 family protein [Frigidibacter oleivorans]|uniref:glycerate kinase type-2 family protein n=1 Tax=Frigidibacter oleivorans TaxID=2487129 RepID=UPI000F8E2664|nr:glycerate kinase [Frigidibacter oleivorans]